MRQVPKNPTDVRLGNELIKLNSFLEEARVYDWETMTSYRRGSAYHGELIAAPARESCTLSSEIDSQCARAQPNLQRIAKCWGEGPHPGRDYGWVQSEIYNGRTNQQSAGCPGHRRRRGRAVAHDDGMR